jgi:hypothetical protein
VLVELKLVLHEEPGELKYQKRQKIEKTKTKEKKELQGEE